MKKAMLLFWPLAVILPSLRAQTNQPVIQTGSTLSYQITDKTGSSHALMLIIASVNDQDILIKWNIPDLGEGNLVMPLAALQTGTHSYWDQPGADVNTRLDHDQTIGCFSRQFYQEIINTGKAEYDGTEYLKNNTNDTGSTFKIGGKRVSALFLTSKDGQTRLWLLNDLEVPLILKIAGNPSGIDATLKGINSK